MAPICLCETKKKKKTIKYCCCAAVQVPGVGGLVISVGEVPAATYKLKLRELRTVCTLLWLCENDGKDCVGTGTGFSG